MSATTARGVILPPQCATPSRRNQRAIKSTQEKANEATQVWLWPQNTWVRVHEGAVNEVSQVWFWNGTHLSYKTTQGGGGSERGRTGVVLSWNAPGLKEYTGGEGVVNEV